MAAALLRMSRRARSSFFSEIPVVRHRNIHTWVWWDLDLCPIPDGWENSIVANVRNGVANLNYDGPVSIAAYHDHPLPLNVEQALTDTGVSLTWVCSRYDTATSAHILYDLFRWAIDHPAPANCLIISNDGALSYGLNELGKHYDILLARHGNACPRLELAAKTLWRWTSLRAGGPPEKSTHITT